MNDLAFSVIIGLLTGIWVELYYIYKLLRDKK